MAVPFESVADGPESAEASLVVEFELEVPLLLPVDVEAPPYFCSALDVASTAYPSATQPLRMPVHWEAVSLAAAWLIALCSTLQIMQLSIPSRKSHYG